jgi:hypothetical protein
MNFPFAKSLFLELLRYNIFREFIVAENILDYVPDVGNDSFRSSGIKKIFLQELQSKIEIIDQALLKFLELHPSFRGVDAAITNMAVEFTLAQRHSAVRRTQKLPTLASKVKLITHCLIQARLPNYSAAWISFHVEKNFKPFHASFDFKAHLLAKITDDQAETINNLYNYAYGIADRFMGDYSAGVFKSLNKIMSSDNMLENFFDRVVVINLDRRKDRWDALQQKLSKLNWPFKLPERFSAYDGSKLPTPVGWTYGSGTWGCLLSHREVLGRAIADGVESILVLEDDIFFSDDFETRVVSFLKGLPADWDQIMLGGQFFDTSKAYDISPEVRQVSLCHRAHAYAVRGNFMRYMYSKLCSSYGHVDHIMNTFQDRYKVYTPRTFLIGQEGGVSDISGAQAAPDLMRNPPEKDIPVFVINPDIELHTAIVESDLPLHYGKVNAQGYNEELFNLSNNPKRLAYNVLVVQLHEMLLSNIWHARSVYPSKYFTILNPGGVLHKELEEAARAINLVFVDSLETVKEVIAKHPFEENLPTQFPEQKSV